MSQKILREAQAIAAIKQSNKTNFGEDSVNLYIQHHLNELPDSYWAKHLGTHTPSASMIVTLLKLKSSWGDGDIEYFDFDLPDNITDYVLSVHFDDSGKVDSILMES